MDSEKTKCKNETETIVSRLKAVTEELNAINGRLEGLKRTCRGLKCEIVQGYTKLAERNVIYATARAYETLAELTAEMAKGINLDEIEKEPF